MSVWTCELLNPQCLQHIPVMRCFKPRSSWPLIWNHLKLWYFPVVIFRNTPVIQKGTVPLRNEKGNTKTWLIAAYTVHILHVTVNDKQNFLLYIHLQWSKATQTCHHGCNMLSHITEKIHFSTLKIMKMSRRGRKTALLFSISRSAYWNKSVI